MRTRNLTERLARVWAKRKLQGTLRVASMMPDELSPSNKPIDTWVIRLKFNCMEPDLTVMVSRSEYRSSGVRWVTKAGRIGKEDGAVGSSEWELRRSLLCGSTARREMDAAFTTKEEAEGWWVLWV